MADEKVPLLVMGKSKSPRSFAGVKNLPLIYIGNSKAWMTSDHPGLGQGLLEEVGFELETSYSKSPHFTYHGQLSCPSTPQLYQHQPQVSATKHNSKVTACDRVIIQSLKVCYRYKLVQKMLVAMDSQDH